MQGEAKRNFLNAVLKEVKFGWDHDEIKAELEGHILDECDYLSTKGFTGEQAEQEALKRLGNPQEIGRMLNQAHSPWIGHLWLFTNILVFLVFCCYIINVWAANKINDDNLPFGWAPAENAGVIEMHQDDQVFHVQCDEVLKLDGYQIQFTDVQCIRNTSRDIYTRDSEYCIYIYYNHTGDLGKDALMFLTPSFFRDDQGRTLAWNAPWLEEGQDDWVPNILYGHGGTFGTTYNTNEMGRFRVYGFVPGTKYIDVHFDFFGQQASCRLDLSEVVL